MQFVKDWIFINIGNKRNKDFEFEFDDDAIRDDINLSYGNYLLPIQIERLIEERKIENKEKYLECLTNNIRYITRDGFYNKFNISDTDNLFRIPNSGCTFIVEAIFWDELPNEVENIMLDWSRKILVPDHCTEFDWDLFGNEDKIIVSISKGTIKLMKKCLENSCGEFCIVSKINIVDFCNCNNIVYEDFVELYERDTKKVFFIR
jgi:hypothetical protein